MKKRYNMMDVNSTACSKLSCRLLGHRFKITKHISSQIKIYTCVKCHTKLTTNLKEHVIRTINSSLSGSDFVIRKTF